MKYIIIPLLFVSFALRATGKPLVVATTTMIADIARNIAGEHLDVRCLLPVGGDPHLYDPTPEDARLIVGADMVLKNGLTLEGWLDKLIENAGTSAVSVVVSEGVDAIQSEEFHNSTDPHAWMDAHNGIIFAQNIAAAFVAMDPANAQGYRQRLSEYTTKLAELDAWIRAEIARIPLEKRVLITSHDAFHYYGRAYNIEVDATMGTSTDADVRTGDIARLNKVIVEKGVTAIFVESTVNPKLLQQLAQDGHIAIGGKLYADSLGEPGGEAGTYAEMLRHNTATIVAALTAAPTSETVASGGPTLWFYLILLGLFAMASAIMYRKVMPV